MWNVYNHDKFIENKARLLIYWAKSRWIFILPKREDGEKESAMARPGNYVFRARIGRTLKENQYKEISNNKKSIWRVKGFIFHKTSPTFSMKSGQVLDSKWDYSRDALFFLPKKGARIYTKQLFVIYLLRHGIWNAIDVVGVKNVAIVHR